MEASIQIVYSNRVPCMCLRLNLYPAAHTNYKSSPVAPWRASRVAILRDSSRKPNQVNVAVLAQPLYF
jgi:hypothetical protein